MVELESVDFQGVAGVVEFRCRWADGFGFVQLDPSEVRDLARRLWAVAQQTEATDPFGVSRPERLAG